MKLDRRLGVDPQPVINHVPCRDQHRNRGQLIMPSDGKSGSQWVRDLKHIHHCKEAPRVWRQLEAERKQLAGLDTNQEECAVVRLCHSFYVGEDTCGRLLENRLRAQQQPWMVQSLAAADGSEIREDSAIAEAFRGFYQEFYAVQSLLSEAPAHYLQEAQLLGLTQEQREALDHPIRIEEVILAIAHLRPLKSLTPDGFSTLFCKTFCTQLAPVLIRLFNAIRCPGPIPPSMKEVAIVVIPKPGKDPKQCALYRPISLPNIDIKLFTSVHAARLNLLMPGLEQ
ncbi:hypothetical protein NDU88_006277 [Pleurodeles waltl]|uniref:Uncharacterized protein n=1 Tax=Pleurodeles waltl TaxID=8319 RepID=A0AAV7RNI0_PLEWA|nr:hypothetical protein NDU88_006277 [Pleurodeles waltl]